ncbi:Uncharacterised protein [Edwardsiella hoshinae]|uniref:Flagellar assembly protein H n=1 Tax=Edwardsiella hoshinae TaxID=93378 RepID=A0A376IY10_9GAMM|nr:Uncharacterised protein [Edwardsiella hoshinae]
MTIAEQLEQKGMQKGMQQGRVEGLVEGRQEAQREMARNMLAIGIDHATIMQVTGLTAVLSIH